VISTAVVAGNNSVAVVDDHEAWMFVPDLAAATLLQQARSNQEHPGPL
jgi:hypothetical protein